MKTADIYSLLDGIIPIITMSFGVYGALKDTKAVNGKLPKAGVIAIMGIIITGMANVAIKVLAYEQKKEEAARVLQKEKNTNDSLRRVAKEELQFKEKVNGDFSKSIELTKTLNTESLQALNQLSRVGQDQKTLITNSLRNIQPFQPLRMQFTVIMTTEFAPAKAYIDKMTALKNSYEANPGQRNTNLIISDDARHRGKIGSIEIRNIKNPFFPKPESDGGLWQQLGSGFLTLIKSGPIKAGDELTGPQFFIRTSPGRLLAGRDTLDANYTCELTVHFDGASPYLEWHIISNRFSTFRDDSRSVYSIYDIKSKYIAVLGGFPSGVELTSLSFDTGGNYWHSTVITYKSNERKQFISHQRVISYFEHRVINEIK